MKKHGFIFAVLVIVLWCTAAFATPTEITVRVKAKDAKFVGTTMGGVLITIKNVQTGELLAKGVTAGGTGNTEKIMTTPVVRGVPISDESAAKYTATINIDVPTQVEVTAYGPLSGQQAANRVSATQWVVPGKNITAGDAWLLEMPGFAVAVLAPVRHTMLTGAPQAVPIRASVMLMCGCPTTPGGIWDSSKYEVKAIISRNGKQVGTIPMEFAGAPSQYSGIYNATEPGIYEAQVYAYDPSNGNTGVDSATFLVMPK